MLPPCAPGRNRVRPLGARHRDAHGPEERGERELDDALPALGHRQDAHERRRALLDRREDAHVRRAAGQLARQRALAVAVRDHAVGHPRTSRSSTVISSRSPGSAPST